MSGDSTPDERRLADQLSEFVDRLNEGASTDMEDHEDLLEDAGRELHDLMETVALLAESAGSYRPELPVDASFAAVQERMEDEGRASERAAIEDGSALVEITKRPDFLILLLREAGDIWGITRLQKLLFLLGKESGITDLVPDYFAHVAYDFGPFDDDVYRDAEGLQQCGLLSTTPPPRTTGSSLVPTRSGYGDREVDAVYHLTDRGRMYADALARGDKGADTAVIDKVRRIVRRYKGMSLNELIAYVYRTYPDTTVNSKIRDEVLGEDEGGES